MNLLLSWLILAAAIWLTAYLLPGVRVRSVGGAFLVAALLGILNVLLGWLFFTLLTIATLGLALLLAFITRWIVDAILLYMISKFTDAIDIEGFKWALIAALVMSLLGTVGQWLLL